MKTIDSINLEYRQVMNQADNLENCADDLKRLRKQLEDVVGSLRGGWAGDSAEVYYDKCRELSEKISKSQKNLDQVASVIQRTAKAYRAAEIASLQIVQD